MSLVFHFAIQFPAIHSVLESSGDADYSGTGRAACGGAGPGSLLLTDPDRI